MGPENLTKTVPETGSVAADVEPSSGAVDGSAAGGAVGGHPAAGRAVERTNLGVIPAHWQTLRTIRRYPAQG
jgi:hypothetical protein